MTVWSTRSGRNCSMRSSARLGRLSVGARDAEAQLEPSGVERADALGQEDSAPVGQGGVGQVAGWASTAPVEGDVGGHARGERIEVGVGIRAFDAHDFAKCARPCHGHPGPRRRGRA